METYLRCSAKPFITLVWPERDLLGVVCLCWPLRGTSHNGIFANLIKATVLVKLRWHDSLLAAMIATHVRKIFPHPHLRLANQLTRLTARRRNRPTDVSAHVALMLLVAPAAAAMQLM